MKRVLRGFLVVLFVSGLLTAAVAAYLGNFPMMCTMSVLWLGSLAITWVVEK